MDLSDILVSAPNTDGSSNNSVSNTSAVTFGPASGPTSGDEANVYVRSSGDTSGRPTAIPEEVRTPRPTSAPAVAKANGASSVENDARPSVQRPGTSSTVRGSPSSPRQRDRSVNDGERVVPATGRFAKSRSPVSRAEAPRMRSKSPRRFDDAEAILERLLAEAKKSRSEEQPTPLNTNGTGSGSTEQQAATVGAPVPTQQQPVNVGPPPAETIPPRATEQATLTPPPVCTSCPRITEQLNAERKAWEMERREIMRAADATYAERQAAWELEVKTLNDRLDLARKHATHLNSMYQGLERKFDDSERQFNTEQRELGRKLDLQTQQSHEQAAELARRGSALEALSRELGEAKAQSGVTQAERAAYKERIVLLENKNSELDVKIKEAEIRLDLMSNERGEAMSDMAKQVAESQVTLGGLQAQITQLTLNNDKLRMENEMNLKKMESRNEFLTDEAKVLLSVKDEEIASLKEIVNIVRREAGEKAKEVVALVQLEQGRAAELNLDLKKLGDRCQSMAETQIAEKVQWRETESLLRGEITVLESQIVEMQELVNKRSGDVGVAVNRAVQSSRGSNDPPDVPMFATDDEAVATKGDVYIMMNATLKKFSTKITKILGSSRNRKRPVDGDDKDENGEETHDSDEENPPSDDDDSSDSSRGPPGGNPPDGDGGDDDRGRGRRAGRGRSSSPMATATATDTNVRERRYKEADTIKVPKFPTVASLDNWKIQVGKNLVAASGRWDLQEVEWFMAINRPESTYESLADSGADRFKILDLKLAAAMGPVIREGGHVLSLAVNIKEKIAAQNNSVVKGRQLVWLLYNHFQTNPSMGFVYSITDLTNLEWMGDAKMQSFLYVWYVMVSGMPGDIEQTTLRNLLHEKIEKSSVLAYDLSHYDRLPEGHQDKSYAFLISCMERYVQKTSQKKNRNEFTGKHLERMLRGAQAAAPGVGHEDGGKPPKKSKKEKKKEKAAKARAQSEARDDQNADAAPAPKGGKGGKGEGKSSTGVPFNKICYYHNHGGCKRGKDCKFNHVQLSDKEKSKLKKPPGSRAGSQPPKKGKGDGKGDKKLTGWCHQHLRPGGCAHGDNCMFPHHEEPAVNEIKRAAAKSKARAKSQGKGNQKS